MYYILYEDTTGKNTWELVSGEEAMQIRVSELIHELHCEADDIIVFPEDAQLD